MVGFSLVWLFLVWFCWNLCWGVLVLLEFLLGGVGFVGISVGGVGFVGILCWGCWFCWNFCWGCWFCLTFVLRVFEINKNH